jgi:hypothetical protein
MGEDFQVVGLGWKSWIEANEAADVVFGGVFSVKEYYLENDNPRQMRGASQWLVDTFNGFEDNEVFGIVIKSIQDLIAENEGLYTSAGASFFALVPPGRGARVALSCEELVLSYTITAQVSVVWQELFDAKLLLDRERFPRLIKSLNHAFEERRFVKFPPLESPWTPSNDPLLPDRNNTMGRSDCYIHRFESQDLCERCRLRTVEFRAYLQEEGDFFLCPSCAHKEFRGGYVQRNHFRDNCAKFAEHELGIHLIVPSRVTDKRFWFGTTDSYADANGDIALLYADINDLGDALNKIGVYNVEEQVDFATEVQSAFINSINDVFRYNFEDYSEFHRAVTEVVQKSLYHAVASSTKSLYDVQPTLFPDDFTSEKGYPSRFEIVAAGGDDICIILPGSTALLAGTLLMEQFEERWNEQKDKFNGLTLTISVGIAIGKAQTPIQFLHDVAEQLLVIAKDRAHDLETHKSDGAGGALDILVVTSEGQWASSVEQSLREKLKKREGDKKANLTMRPFSRTESREFLQNLNQAVTTIPPSTLLAIETASKKCGIAEGDLWFEYQLSRQTNQNKNVKGDQEGDLRKLAHRFGKDCKMYYASSDGLVSPWHDIAELRNQIGGGCS